MDILRSQDLSNLSNWYPDFVRICRKSSNFWDDVADLRSQIRFRTLSSELENTQTRLAIERSWVQISFNTRWEWVQSHARTNSCSLPWFNQMKKKKIKVNGKQRLFRCSVMILRQIRVSCLIFKKLKNVLIKD